MDRKIIRNIFLVSVLTIGAKGLGFLREVALGNIFGVGMEADMYFQGFKYSIFLFLSAGGVITVALIPELLARKEKDSNPYGLVNELMSFMLVGSFILIALMVTLGPWYARLLTNYEGQELWYFIQVLQIMFATIIFFGPIYVYMSILHVHQNFLPNNLSSLLHNGIMILYLLLVGNRYGVLGFSVVIFIGWAFQWLVLVGPVRKTGYRFKLTFRFFTPRVFALLKKAPSILVVISTFGLLNLGDTIVTAYMPEGSTAGLNFAFSLYGAFATTIVLSVSTVLFPEIAKWVKSLSDARVIKGRINQQIAMLVLVFIPITAGIYVLADDIIRLFFGFTNQFGQEDFILTANALKAYFLGFVAFGIFELLTKVYLAKEAYRFLSISSLVVVILNGVLNYVLKDTFGVMGIAVTTSAILTVYTAVLWMRFGVEKVALVAIVKALLAAMMMVLVIGMLPLEQTTQWGRLILMLGKVTVGMLVYAGVLFALKTEQLKIIKTFIWRK